MPGRPVVTLLCVGPQRAADLAAYLERRGCETRIADEAWALDHALGAGDVDVAVVGHGLPQHEASDLLRRHARGIGFIVMTGTDDMLGKVLALELGAADAIDAGLPPREIAARVRGLLARRGAGGGSLVVLERASVDLRSALVMHRSGEEEQLSPGQVMLLRLFIERPRTVLSRDDIIAVAPAGEGDAYDRSIDSRIVRLRRKLDTDSIITVRGAGYRFDPPWEDA